MSKDVMQMALEALEKAEEVIEDEYGGTSAFTRLSCAPAITALREALLADVTPAQMAHADAVAKPEQEPVAYFDPQEKGFYWAKPTVVKTPMSVSVEPLPLYSAPTSRRPLTDEEISVLWEGHTVPVFGKTGINPVVFARAIERAHGIGEQT